MYWWSSAAQRQDISLHSLLHCSSKPVSSMWIRSHGLLHRSLTVCSLSELETNCGIRAMYNLKAMDLLSCFQKAPSLLSPLLSMNYSVEVCKKPFWIYALSLASGRKQGACSSSSTRSNIIPWFLLLLWNEVVILIQKKAVLLGW